MAVTKEIAHAEMARPHVTDRPADMNSFTFEKNFSILQFPGGGHLLQQEGGKWTKAFGSTDELVHFLVDEKSKIYKEKDRVHSDATEFGLGCSDKSEASPHDYVEPLIEKRRSR